MTIKKQTPMHLAGLAGQKATCVKLLELNVISFLSQKNSMIKVNELLLEMAMHICHVCACLLVSAHKAHTPNINCKRFSAATSPHIQKVEYPQKVEYLQNTLQLPSKMLIFVPKSPFFCPKVIFCIWNGICRPKLVNSGKRITAKKQYSNFSFSFYANGEIQSA